MRNYIISVKWQRMSVFNIITLYNLPFILPFRMSEWMSAGMNGWKHLAWLPGFHSYSMICCMIGSVTLCFHSYSMICCVIGSVTLCFHSYSKICCVIGRVTLCFHGNHMKIWLTGRPLTIAPRIERMLWSSQEVSALRSALQRRSLSISSMKPSLKNFSNAWSGYSVKPY